VPFSAGSATLGGIAQAVLDDKAAILQLNPSLKVRIQSTGKDASYGESVSLSKRRNDAVRAYLVANGVLPTQIILGTVAGSEARIGAGFDIEAGPQSDVEGLSITALKQTPTVVRTRPGLEVFTLPRNLANDSVRILCSPPPAARFGVADASGVVSGPLLPKSLVFVARDSAKIFTLQHDVSLVADPDRIDMTKQLPDPRCK
jgi:hypothetical protein